MRIMRQIIKMVALTSAKLELEEWIRENSEIESIENSRFLPIDCLRC